MMSFKKIIRSQKGQSLTELGLALPILILLAFGAIEFSNLIQSYLVLSHLTREGANMTSRGNPPEVPGPGNDALDAVIAASCPMISDGLPCAEPPNPQRWTIIHSRIGPNPDGPSPPYVVLQQVTRGAGPVVNVQRVCPGCSSGNFTCATGCVAPSNVPDLGSINPGGQLDAVEVFYLYQPVLGTFFPLGSDPIYERAIF